MRGYESKKIFHFDNLYRQNPKEYSHFRLYQIGDLSCKKGYLIEEHEQECFEISYIYEGRGSFIIDGSKYFLAQGDVCINAPGELHSIHADGDEYFRFFYVGFDIKSSSRYKKLFMDKLRTIRYIDKPYFEDKNNIGESFLYALNELSNANEFSELMIESCLNKILIKTLTSLSNIENPIYKFNNILGTKKELIYNTISYIDYNIFKIKKLKQISNSLGYSYSHLSHTFKEEIGVTLQEYFLNKRIQKAKELLIEKNQSVSEVAETLSYQSIHSFSKAFKNAVGVSPAAFQRNKSIKI
ncbi:AraC family transcriptional regulator [Clostridium swellfunianum]|uniref:helix-turn-helix domain-containing protein n=1 Tax=Clostridium swellfunianum TaxID=1367462 RepID=UPI00202DF920|nr:AraC family transcriptional regulator [Clostridium swellfunianum]MCM0647582.1 AraC family transcriptional regulator [Clostridium swellfunianum]